jgi:hypothetical protein
MNSFRICCSHSKPVFFPPPVALRTDSGSVPPLRAFDITLIGHGTLSRTPVYELQARRTYHYLTTHNLHMPSVRFEPAVPASELPQTHASNSVATGIDALYC